MSLVPLGLRSGGFPNAKFDLGALVATPGAVTAQQQAGVSARQILERHVRGDWGSVHPGDIGMNDEALCNGERLHSVYPLRTNETIWVITEWNRSVTTLLLPDEY